jgi:hypothetical protein
MNMLAVMSTGLALAGLVVLRNRGVRRRVDKDANNKGRQFVIRKSSRDEDWSPALPTVSTSLMRKRDLFSEPESGRFALELILSPHQRYPAHLHGSNEWCFLVQGELTDQFGTKFAGDFFYNEVRSLHYGIQAGKDGCTILVVKDCGGNMPRPDLDD